MSKQQQQQAKMTQILEETVKYYSEDTKRRAIDSHGECVYTTQDGNHCAIGRYLKPEYQNTEWGHNEDTSVTTLYANILKGIDSLLVESVKGLPLLFWVKLQNLHDSNGNWDDDITFNGLNKVRRIENYIKGDDNG